MKDLITNFLIRTRTWIDKAPLKSFRLLGFRLLAFLFLSFYSLELILRLNTGLPFYNDGLLYSYLFAGVLSGFLWIVHTLLPVTYRFKVTGVILLLITLLFASQLIYYKIFKTFYTSYSAANGGQVLEFLPDILRTLGENLLWLLLLFIPFILFVILRPGKDAALIEQRWRERGFTLLMAGLLLTAALGNIQAGDRETHSAYDVYYRSNYPPASVNRLGLLTSMRLDLYRTLTNFEIPAPPPVLASGTKPPVYTAAPAPAARPESTPDGPDAGPVQGDTLPDPEETPVIYSDNVLDIDYDRLIAETTDETLKDMHLFFSSRTPTKKNAYTGRFKDYNLILITAESFSHYAIDEKVTPTLYKMSREGFQFTDFYNPIWGVSTSDGEYVATTGLIPKSGVWSMYKSGSISMPFTMGSQLRELGYNTLAYHNHTFDYYRRDISHPNLGYEYKGLGKGLDVAPTWPESDLEMMEKTADEYMDSEPFHAYYMTVSGHMDYDFAGNFIAGKNRELVKDLPYLEAGKAYMATQIELDRALEHLLKKLDEKGLAERTLIAISSDHYPYGLAKNELDDLAGHEVKEPFELYRSSFILYAGGMEPEIIDRPVSSLDVIPTISNLMGLDYDSRLLMGTDVFSDSCPQVIFTDRSFITDVGIYDTQTREFILKPGFTMTEQDAENYRRAVSAEIDRLFYYSAKILETDYYSKVLIK